MEFNNSNNGMIDISAQNKFINECFEKDELIIEK